MEMLEVANSVNKILLLYADWALIEEYQLAGDYFQSGYFAGHIVFGIYFELLTL